MAEGGGTGITTMPVLQSLAQARDRWSEHQAGAIWDASIVKIILGGASNSRDLQDLSTLIGERDEYTDSVTLGDHGTRSNQRSIRRVPILPPDRIRTLPFGTGITMLRSAPPIVTDLRAWPTGPMPRNSAATAPNSKRCCAAVPRPDAGGCRAHLPDTAATCRLVARVQEDAIMAIRTQESISGFIASDPQLTYTERGDARLYARSARSTTAGGQRLVHADRDDLPRPHRVSRCRRAGRTSGSPRATTSSPRATCASTPTSATARRYEGEEFIAKKHRPRPRPHPLRGGPHASALPAETPRRSAATSAGAPRPAPHRHRNVSGSQP
jgi:hypothetical protein